MQTQRTDPRWWHHSCIWAKRVEEERPSYTELTLQHYEQQRLERKHVPHNRCDALLMYRWVTETLRTTTECIINHTYALQHRTEKLIKTHKEKIKTSQNMLHPKLLSGWQSKYLAKEWINPKHFPNVSAQYFSQYKLLNRITLIFPHTNSIRCQ